MRVNHISAYSGVIGLLAAGSVSAQTYTQIIDPIQYPNWPLEKTIPQILGHRYGGTFVPSSPGSVNFSNGSLTAQRIPDSLPAAVTPLVMDNPTRGANDTDQVWLAMFLPPTPEAVWAGYVGDGSPGNPYVSFGFFEGDGVAGGNIYTRLFEIPASSTPPGYFFNTPLMFATEIPRKPVRPARAGGPPPTSYSPAIPRLVSSKNSDNRDEADHMVSYEILGLPSIAGELNNRTFLLCFEDLFEPEPSDHDFNDLVVEMKSSIVPAERWIRPNSGNWNDPSNWAGGVPNSPFAVANFFMDITSDTTVTLDSPIGVNILRLGSEHRYTFVGNAANALTIFAYPPPSDPSENPYGRINVEEGSHTFLVPVRIDGNSFGSLQKQMSLNVFRSQDVLTFAGDFTVSNSKPLIIVKGGPGRVDMKKLQATGSASTSPLNLRVDAGTLRFVSGGGTSKVNTLTIDTTTVSAKLDITNNALVIDYATTSPLLLIRDYLKSAYAVQVAGGANWQGPGLSSMNADGNHFGIGYAEASALSSIPSIFGSVDGTSVLVRVMRFGDTDFNGIVNLMDFNRLTSNFGSINAVWTQGDFDYNGTVNLRDFNLLAANFGLSAGPDGPTPQDWAALAAAVPEPAALSVVGLAALAMVRRRK